MNEDMVILLIGAVAITGGLLWLTYRIGRGVRYTQSGRGFHDGWV